MVERTTLDDSVTGLQRRYNLPVGGGGSEEKRLQAERAEFPVGSRGVRGDDAKREAIAQKRELLKA